MEKELFKTTGGGNKIISKLFCSLLTSSYLCSNITLKSLAS